jgi:hypothetical protein
MKPRPLESRPYVAGRLRNGVMGKMKRRDGSSYTAPVAVDYWMFTSPDLDMIEQLQGAYGGEVTEWNEPKANPPQQFKLTTNTNRISVWLPVDALDVQWERWEGNFCERRCDQEMCWYQTKHTSPEQIPCVCGTEPGDARCKPKSRLSVLLPAANLAGVWRYDSGSYHFATEAPDMIRQIEVLNQARRISRVDLVLTNRVGTTIVNEKRVKSNFIVPTIQIAHTPEEILGGQIALTQGMPMLALDKGWTEPVIHDSVWHTPLDDEVCEAEIMGEDDVTVRDTPVKPPAMRVDEPNGWDTPPAGVSVKRNPKFGEPGEPKYIRKV